MQIPGGGSAVYQGVQHKPFYGGIVIVHHSEGLLEKRWPDHKVNGNIVQSGREDLLPGPGC